MAWAQPSDVEIAELLRTARTIAVVGASARPARPSNGVVGYLRDAGYEVWPVNPTVDEIDGMRCYPSLADLPEAPDLVDVFRRLEDVPAVAIEAVAVGAKALWTQLALWSPEAANIAHEAGLTVVMDRCTKTEHRRLLG